MARPRLFRPCVTLPAALVLTAALAGACTPAPPPSRSTQAARAACRAESEASYNRQHRDLLSTRDSTDTPFSTSGLGGNPTAGLSQEYARESALDDCLSGIRTGTAAPVPATAAAGAPAGTGAAFKGPAGAAPGLPGP